MTLSQPRQQSAQAPFNGKTAPRAAYIHVPFCAHRCGYCNFTLVAGRADLIEPYLAAIELELAMLGEPREVDTLYFGGGTPTQLSTDEFQQLAKAALYWHPLAVGAEWTVEANPADLTAELVAVMQEAGVTRISLGAQSFAERKLALLERDHRAADVERSVNLARQAGLQVALDLIFATPGETLADWQADLEDALELEPDHFSTYGLTFERGSSFFARRERGELRPQPEELESEMYLAAIDQLTAAGCEHYEVSNFARPGMRSRHNQVYWTGEGYWAAGPGAARYVDGLRQTNHRSTTTWLRRVLDGESPVAEEEQLAPEDRARELLVFGLRRLEGVERRDFAARSGYELDALVGSELKELTALDLLADDGQRVRLTRGGLLVSDSIMAELL